jgi:hypothetical protein
MRFQLAAVFAAALALAASPALADLGPAGWWHPAPAPVAGAGLGFLVLAGGYHLVRRWRRQTPGE